VPGRPYFLWEFDAGMNHKYHIAGFYYEDAGDERFTAVAPIELDARVFLRKADGSEGWFYRLADRGWSVFGGELPATGRSIPPPRRDILYLGDGAVEATLRLSAATFCRALFAQGAACGFVIRVRDSNPKYQPAAILLDPIGPPGAQERVDWTPDEVFERSVDLEERLWVEWGFGPRPGVRFSDLDLTQEQCEAVLDRASRHAPPYWSLMLTGLHSYVETDDTGNLADWPVLVVRGARSTPTMDARRESVIAWLTARGAQVDRLDLAAEGPPGLSNLPMLGRGADQVADLLEEWLEALPPNPNFKGPAVRRR
jgi:hypothetical protein